jgi:Family of unknown function (DUF5996)
MSVAWGDLGKVAPVDLLDVRLEAHWAAQALSAVGAAHVTPRPDDSHTGAVYHPELGALLGDPLSRSPERRVGLRLADLVLFVLDPDRTSAELRLEGHTLDDAFRFLARQLGGPALRLPSYELPEHPVSAGAPFSSGHEPNKRELALWYENAHAALSEVAERETGASSVRVWPHHFDIATLITVRAAHDAEQARSVGVGMSPGDSSYPEPYFYVAPWPHPRDRSSLPALPETAHWHVEGWVGAVLPASELCYTPDQHAALRAFLASAITACRTLVT